MSSIGSVSLAGLQSATAQFQSAADRIANPGSTSDIGADIVDAVAAKTNVQISLQIIKAEHEMTKALVDILI